MYVVLARLHQVYYHYLQIYICCTARYDVRYTVYKLLFIFISVLENLFLFLAVSGEKNKIKMALICLQSDLFIFLLLIHTVDAL